MDKNKDFFHLNESINNIKKHIETLIHYKQYQYANRYRTRLNELIEQLKDENFRLTSDDNSLSLEFLTPVNQIRTLESDINAFIVLNIDKMKEMFINDELESIIKNLKRDSTKESWERFFATVKDKTEDELIRNFYGITAIEILIDQGADEGKVDISLPLSTIENTWGKNFLRDALKEKLLNSALDIPSKADQFVQLAETLSEENPNSIQNVGNVKIWRLLIGREDVQVIYPYLIDRSLPDRKITKTTSVKDTDDMDEIFTQEIQTGGLKKIFRAFQKDICTITYPNGVIVNYKNWEEIDFKKMSLAVDIELYTEIPQKYFEYPLKLLKFKNLKVLKFHNGVELISNQYNSDLCPQLEEVYISQSVEEIQPHAFSGLQNLKKVTFENIPARMNSTVFEESSIEQIILLNTRHLYDLNLKNCYFFKSIKTEDGQEIPFYSTPDIISDGDPSKPFLIVFNEKEIKYVVQQRNQDYYCKYQNGEKKEEIYINKHREFNSELRSRLGVSIYPSIPLILPKEGFVDDHGPIIQFFNYEYKNPKFEKGEPIHQVQRLEHFACSITSIEGIQSSFKTWDDVTPEEQKNAKILKVYEDFPFLYDSLPCKDWENLDTLIFKPGVTSVIGLNDTFKKLRYIVFSKTIETISFHSYWDCHNLEKIYFEGDFPSGMDGAFRNSALKEIEIKNPTSLSTTTLTLEECPSFERIYTSFGKNLPYKRCLVNGDEITIVFNDKTLDTLKDSLFTDTIEVFDVPGDSQESPDVLR